MINKATRKASVVCERQQTQAQTYKNTCCCELIKPYKFLSEINLFHRVFKSDQIKHNIITWSVHKVNKKQNKQTKRAEKREDKKIFKRFRTPPFS